MAAPRCEKLYQGWFARCENLSVEVVRREVDNGRLGTGSEDSQAREVVVYGKVRLSKEGELRLTLLSHRARLSEHSPLNNFSLNRRYFLRLRYYRRLG